MTEERPLLDDPRCTYRGIHKAHDHVVTWYTGSRDNPQVTKEEYHCPGTDVRLDVVARKICSGYDSVCLEGGCGYCDQGKWRSVSVIEQEVRKAKNLKLLAAFSWGLRHEFANVRIRFADKSEARPYKPRPGIE